MEAAVAEAGKSRDLLVFGATGIEWLAWAGNGSFAPPAAIVPPSPPPATPIVDAETLDVDGDGDDDVIYATQSHVFLVINSAGGSSWSAPSVVFVPVLPATGNLVKLAVTDVDHDGRHDLVIATARHLYLAYNNASTGSFSLSLVADSGDGIIALDVVDWDRVGAPDAVFATSDLVAVVTDLAPGRSARSLANATVVAPPNVISSVINAMVVADFTGDGMLDVAVCGNTPTAGYIVVFAAAAPSPQLFNTLTPLGTDVAFVAAHASSATYLDLVLLDVQASTVKVLRGKPPVDGAPAFELAPPIVSVASSSPSSVLVADVDDDGVADVIVTTASTVEYTSGIALRGSWSTGVTVVASPAGTFPPKGLTPANYDNDGHPDLTAIAAPGVFAVYRSYFVSGQLLFHPADAVFTPGSSMGPTVFATADINADGRSDFFVPSNNEGAVRAVTSLVSIPGTNLISASYALPLVDVNGISVVVGDFSGDGITDMVTTMTGPPSPAPRDHLAVAHGVSGDSFVLTSTIDVAALHPIAAVFADDVTADGITDLVVLNSGSYFIHLIEGLGNATFRSVLKPMVIGTAVISNVVVVDVDNDGAADVVYSTDRLHICFSRNGGAYFDITPVEATTGVAAAVVADISGNGLVDLVAALATEVITAYQLAPGVFLPSVTVSYASTHSPVSATLLDVSGDGAADLVFSNTGNAIHALAWQPGGLAPAAGVTLVADCLSFTITECFITPLTRVSRCTPTTILLPPGKYTGCPSTHISVEATTVTYAPAGTPGSVTIDCSAHPGPLFAVSGGGSLTLRGLVVRGLASPPGAGVDVSVPGAPLLASGSASELVLVDTSIEETYSNTTGGAVAVLAGAAATITGSNITLASARGFGGAVYVASGAEATITASRFVACSSGSDGGAVAVSGTLTMTDSAIFGSSADNTGGGIGVPVELASIGAVVAVNGSTIANCTAASGGGIGAILTAITVTDSTITGCSAEVAGGAIFQRLSGNELPLVITGSTLSRSSAGYSGGCVMSMTTTVVTDSVFDRCVTDGSGGAMMLKPVSDDAVVDSVLAGVTVTAASAGGAGGAIFISGQAFASDAGPAVAAMAAGVWRPTALPLPPPLLSTVRIRDGLVIDGAESATIGGGFFVCQLDLIDESTTAPPVVTGTSAVLAGGVGFFCDGNALPSAVAGGGVLASALGTLTGTPSAEAQPYGSGWASPPVGMAWADVPPAAVGSAVPLGRGVAVLVDAFGTPCVDSRVELELALVDDTGLLLRNDAVVAASTAGYDMSAVGVALDGGAPFAGRTAAVVLIGHLPPLPIRPLLHAPPAVDLAVGLCPPGFGSASAASAVLVCEPCRPGETKPGTSTEACALVPACPDHMLLAGGSNGSCVCEAGFWAPPGKPAAAGCSPCPPGGRCASGLAAPLPAAGFYPHPSAVHVFLRCRRPRACPGGSATVPCAPTASGFLCNTCAPAHYTAPDGECARCPPWAPALPLIVVVALLAAAAATGAVVARREVPATAVGAVVVGVQAVALLARARLAWPTGAQTMLTALAAAGNSDLIGLAWQCVVGGASPGYLVSLMAVPLVVASGAVAGGAAAGYAAGTGAAAGGRRVAGAVAPALLIPLLRQAAAVFVCLPLADGSHVVADEPGVACFTAGWTAAAVFAAIVTAPALAYVVVAGRLAAAVAACGSGQASELARRQAAAFRRAYVVRAVVGGLTARMVLAIGVAALAVHPLAMLSVVGGVVFAGGLCLAAVRPLYVPRHNAIALRVALVVLVAVLLGAAAYAERASKASDGVLTVAVAVLVAGLVSLAGHGLYLDFVRTAPPPATERQKTLIALVSTELKDVEADADLLRAAGAFLAAFDDKGSRT
ncbi:uncharacterized protein AMSG_11247 [Thecamonas trahens ATCC 50062]|uniref:Uncharacterized protein n=1 Tax=Thecamonas trahens ATCC 50062 TaxID=461836 RepID=A0A0L0DUS1_THETB|nr:hypothetical protein AMSG_11247 [Thecamonas trahens ATCC 50062]KNC55811.1 hypothetical protein AMSG_11247 [Thecamonas trahens ATCC 50062]|eukprot:XP_013752834.1 hypothetical protein AMSG_11247 [Thecamonas trahens ATCC 50062]